MLFRHRLTRIPFRADERPRKTGRRLQRIELDLAHDRHARAAIEAYADSCATEMPWLAGLLHEAAAASGDTDPMRCRATALRTFELAHAWAATQPDYAQAAWDHVRIHLSAALTRQPALQDGQQEHDDDSDRELPDRFANTIEGERDQ